MKNTGFLTAPLALLALLLLLNLSACKGDDSRSDAYGNFEATTTTVSAEANGQLLYLKVEEGQPLKAGSTVGIVDTTNLHLQLKQVEARINTLPDKLRSALADIQVLQDQKANLRRERDRVQSLVESKAAPSKQLDDLNGEIEVVDQRIHSIRSTTNTANRAILSEKEPLLAQVALLKNQIRESRIVNPISGTVLTKLAEPHEVVGMGAPLYRIARLDTMTLRVYASSVQLQQVRIGQSVKVLIDEGTDQLKSIPGTVAWISEQAEFTPKTIQTREDRVNLVYALKVRVPNPSGNLKIGMPAEVEFTH